MNFSKLLNKPQQKVVETIDGPILVLAGAGSGKTRSVIFRTAYLINEKKISSQNILVVTFTNKAANELKFRLKTTFKIDTYSLWVGTFHSICARILRFENGAIPYNSNFTIYDAVDTKSLLKKVYKKLEVDPKKFPFQRVISIISNQKNSLILPKDFFLFNEENYFTETVHKIYVEYQKILMENNGMDFDDLLMNTALLLHDNETIRQKYQQKFRYVMIDEYQDTNYAQFKIVNLIAKNHQNLCVVGDDDQAIYSWRGADIKNILNFEKDYKNVFTVKLEQNYRSPQSILDAANCLIKNNYSRHQKALWSDIQSNTKVELIEYKTERDEADFVVQKISGFSDNLNECVILYRTNAQSRVFESAFMRKNIRYQVVGGVNFYQRKEIKDILAYLKVFVNSQDNESLMRIMNFPPRGIGKTSLQKIINFAADNELKLMDAVQSDGILKYIGNRAKKIEEFSKKMAKWQKEAGALDIPDFIEKLINELELKDLYYSDDPQDIARIENIEELIVASQEFCENFQKEVGGKPQLTQYLQSILLQTDLDNYDENEQSVKLMTMHNAKGLEFENVFIVGLEEGLLPHSRSLENECQLEEERRLFYVAITRAKKRVFMSFAQTRRTFADILYNHESCFLKEIDEKFIQRKNVKRDYLPKRKINVDIVLENKKHFKIGQKITHSKFGEGVVLSVAGKGDDAKLTISFSNGVLKKIIGTFVRKL